MGTESSLFDEIFLSGLLAWKGAVVVLCFALFFFYERLFPAAPRSAVIQGNLSGGGKTTDRLSVLETLYVDRARLFTNAGLWAINALLSPLIILPLTATAVSWSSEWSIFSLTGLGAPGEGGQAVSLSRLALELILLDFMIYWWHRANHAWPFLWRFHEIHHLDRWLDTTSALRFHFMEVLLSAGARAAVIVLLGFSLISVVVFEGIVLIAALFHHSNIRLPKAMESRLSRLVITPSIHWVHHHALKSDTDSNYGTVFSFWDRIFGSSSPHSRNPAMTIGVEAPENRDKGLVTLALADRPLGNLCARPFSARPGR